MRLNKRLQHGVSLGANYQYGHAIDDASSVNGSSAAPLYRTGRTLPRRKGTRFSMCATRCSGTISSSCPSAPISSGSHRAWALTSLKASRYRAASTLPRAAGSRQASSRRHKAWSAATPAACGPISHRRNRPPPSAACASGSTPRPTLRPQPPPGSATTSAARRATPSRGREQSQQHGALQNHAYGRNPQHGNSRQINNVFNTVQYAGVEHNLRCAAFRSGRLP